MMCSKGVKNRASIPRSIIYYNLKEYKELLLSHRCYKRKIPLLSMFQCTDPQIEWSCAHSSCYPCGKGRHCEEGPGALDY